MRFIAGGRLIFQLLFMLATTSSLLARASVQTPYSPLQSGSLSVSIPDIYSGCSTPSSPVVPSRLDISHCVTEYSVFALSRGDWNELKWGTIEVSCSIENQHLVFTLQSSPRFSLNPFKIGSGMRRIAGSVDIKASIFPLPTGCECDSRGSRPLFVELFEREQYIVGAKVLSSPRRLHEFYPAQTTCPLPFAWSVQTLEQNLFPTSPFTALTAAAGAAAEAAAAAGVSAPIPGKLQELERCVFKVRVAARPRVFATKTEVVLTGSEALLRAEALGGSASEGILSYKLPRRCYMRDVAKQLKVWIQDAAAAAAAAAAADVRVFGFVRPGLELQQQQLLQQQGFEVYIQVAPLPHKRPRPDRVYYRRLHSLADFELAVSRGQ